ncbi:MAG: hypothetical protein K8H74_03680 [Notoacmeibacter sp.]|nr:hypothetical protein [Notoacmeibacter sp.]
MIRVFATTIWLCGATIAGTFTAFQLAHSSAPKEGVGVAQARDERYTESELMAVPVIAGNEISGYFLARMGYVFDASRLAKTDVPIEILLGDIFLSFAYNNDNIDISNSKNVDILKFSEQLVEYINFRLGAEVVISNLILQVDYRKMNEVRTSITETH